MEVFHLIYTQYNSDVRIDKEIKSLRKYGYKAQVISYGQGTNEDDIDIQLNSRSKMLRIVEFYFKASKELKKRDPAIIHAHDFLALPISYLLVRRHKLKLVFDAHELYHVFNNYRWLKKKFFKYILPKTHYIFTINESIKKKYEQDFKLSNVGILKNAPNFQVNNLDNTNLLSEEFDLKDKKIILFQGYIVLGRGLERTIELLSLLPNDYVLVMMGEVSTEYKNELMKRVKEKGIMDRVYFKSAVKYTDIPKYTSSAGIGIFIPENLTLNSYYTLPNKLFEYGSSGLPMLVYDYPDMKGFVEGYGIGEAVDENISTEDLVKTVIEMFNEQNQKKYKDNLQKYHKEFLWEHEEKELIKIYDKLREGVIK